MVCRLILSLSIRRVWPRREERLRPLSHVFGLKMARQTAEAFLKEEGIASLPVDPFAIAESRDIMVEGKPEKAEGVSGMLLRHGNSFGIV
jgi:hypothetical protein